MKLEQLSGATVLRPDITVKKKNSARSGCTGSRVSPVVKSPSGTLLRYKGHEIVVVVAGEKINEEPDRPRRAYVETLYRTLDGRAFYLVRDSWAGWIGDSERRRHRYRVRHVGRLGAVIFKSAGLMPPLTQQQVKVARRIRLESTEHDWYGGDPYSDQGWLASQVLSMAEVFGPMTGEVRLLAAVLGARFGKGVLS